MEARTWRPDRLHRSNFRGIRCGPRVDLGLLLLLLAVAAIAAGLVGSLTGLGGAVVVIPVLVIFFSIPFVNAIGAGAITVLATSTTTGAAYVRDRLSDLRIGMFLEIVTVPGALLGASLTVLIAHLNLASALMVALGTLLLLMVPLTALRGHRPPRPTDAPDARSRRLGLVGSYNDPTEDGVVHYAAANTDSALGIMFGAGLVSGMFGIGGGVFKVQALEGALHLPMKVATATSNFMIGVTIAAGASVLLAAGYINPVIAAPVAIGTAIGAYSGSRVLPGLRNQTVRWIFIFVVAALAAELILRGIGLP
jgi:uncharacterized protein